MGAYFFLNTSKSSNQVFRFQHHQCSWIQDTYDLRPPDDQQDTVLATGLDTVIIFLFWCQWLWTLFYNQTTFSWCQTTCWFGTTDCHSVLRIGTRNGELATILPSLHVYKFRWNWSCAAQFHGDVMLQKRFPQDWPTVIGIRDSSHKGPVMRNFDAFSVDRMRTLE